MSEAIKVRVSARPEKGFYRAGRYWSSAPTDAEVTANDLKVLKAETNLVVVELGEDGEDPNVTLETEKADLTQKVAALEKINGELEDALTHEKAENQKQFDHAQAGERIKNNDISVLQGKVAALEAKNGELGRDLTGTNNAKIRLETEKADLTQKVAALEAKLKELEKKPK
ncbi:MAG: Mu-like prophage FluMu N-terminal domain [Deinococcota bacterium]|jgi:chromosome segregation ATPase